MLRLINASGKLQLMDRLLMNLKDKEHKILIFSQSTMMLDIIEDYIRWRNFTFERIDGSTASSDRQAAIDRFNSLSSKEDFLFLISTRAGRLGLNLASADTVIIYDSDYNPHNDLQALSRAHRIGQHNIVMIYRLFCKNTVEQVVLERGRSKLVLEHIVVGKMEQKLTKDEISEMIRKGAQKLFDEEENNENPDENNNNYGGFDEEQFQKILDRKQCLIEYQETQKKQSGLQDDGLNTFSLTDVWKTVGEDDENNDDENPLISQNNFWENLLKDRYKKFEETQKKNSILGKRRTRNSSIRYNNLDVIHDDNSSDEDVVMDDNNLEEEDDEDEIFVPPTKKPATGSVLKNSAQKIPNTPTPTPTPIDTNNTSTNINNIRLINTPFSTTPGGVLTNNTTISSTNISANNNNMVVPNNNNTTTFSNNNNNTIVSNNNSINNSFPNNTVHNGLPLPNFIVTNNLTNNTSSNFITHQPQLQSTHLNISNMSTAPVTQLPPTQLTNYPAFRTTLPSSVPNFRYGTGLYFFLFLFLFNY